jgi:hypothetical protein
MAALALREPLRPLPGNGRNRPHTKTFSTILDDLRSGHSGLQ